MSLAFYPYHVGLIYLLHLFLFQFMYNSVAPIVELGSQDQESPEVLAGNNLTLSVNITTFNLPLTNIMWTRNDDTIISGQDRITVSNPSLSAPVPVMSTLMRSSVIPLDDGNYTITATNPAGSNMYTFRVPVTGMFY